MRLPLLYSAHCISNSCFQPFGWPYPKGAGFVFILAQPKVVVIVWELSDKMLDDLCNGGAKMRLCFGVFAKILNLCKQNITQVQFVPRIAWVVDRCNSSLGSGVDFVVEDPEGMEGNGSVVTNLLGCKKSLVLREGCRPSVEVARDRFKSKVMPFIKEGMVKKAILAVLYVIHEDETIDSDHLE